MPLVLSEVLLSDLPEVHRLSLSADQHSATAELLFPNGPSEASITHLVKQDEKDMRDLSSTSRRVIIRDLPTDGRGKGEAVSYALWDFFVGKDREGKGQNDEGRGGDGACHESWPPDANQEALGALVEMGKRKREGIMANHNYAFLASLCTAPTHRRLGAASQLVEWGLALADTHQLPSYVESTPAGLQFYLKHGFEKVDTMEIDLRPWGRNHVQEHTILIRPAKQQPFIPAADQIIITPFLTNEDFISFKEIEHAAFGPENTTTLGSLSPSSEPSQEPSSIITLITHNIHETVLLENSLTDPTSHYIKALHPSDTSTILGYTLWNIPSTALPHPPNPPINTERIPISSSRLHTTINEYTQGQPYIVLDRLAVLPSYQDKHDVEKRLVEWGVREADEKGVECWVGVRDGNMMRFWERGEWKRVGVVELEGGLGEEGEKGGKERVVLWRRKLGGRG